jgi:hypothetical protein
MKILYITGSSRCGSTMLANILGELPGFFSAGELRFLWDRARQGRLCGCGSPITACELWSQVLDRTAATSPGRLDEIRAWQRSVIRLHRTPGVLTSGSPRASSSLGRYLDVLGRTIGSVERSTACEVLVDSSKHPAQAAALLRLGNRDVSILQLVRDPRAVAYSQLRWKPNPDGVRTGGMGGASDLVRHGLGARHSTLLRYEDLVSDPVGHVGRILDWIDEPRPLSPTPFVEGRSIALGPNHTVSGNPDRFTRGRIEVRPDDRWLHEMRDRDRRTATVLTSPLLLHYGYEMRPTPRS